MFLIIVLRSANTLHYYLPDDNYLCLFIHKIYSIVYLIAGIIDTIYKYKAQVSSPINFGIT